MNPVLTAGVGLKPQHFDAALACPAEGLWFEVHPENYMVDARSIDLQFTGAAYARMVSRKLVAIVVWNPVCRLLRLLRNRDPASTSAGQQWQIEITVRPLLTSPVSALIELAYKYSAEGIDDTLACAVAPS